MKKLNRTTSLILFNLGNSYGFDQVYKETWDSVFGQVLRQLGDLEAANDICTDSYIRLWKRKGNFASLSAINAYLSKVARNETYDYLREHRVEIIYKGLLAKDLWTRVDNQFEELDLRYQLIFYLEKLITGLPPRAQEIVRLAYLRGLSNRDIAALLRIREKTVCNIKLRAVQRLKLQLTGLPGLATMLRMWFLDLQ